MSGALLNEAGSPIQDESGVVIDVESGTPLHFVGFNILAPEFYLSIKPFTDMGAHASVRIDTSNPSNTVDTDGWPTGGESIISWDTYVPYSWDTGDYDVSWTGAGSLVIELISGASPPTFFLDTEERFILRTTGEISSLSLTPSGDVSQFTTSFLERASRAMCVRFMDPQYTNAEDFDPDHPHLHIQVSGSETYYHHSWTWQEMVDLSNAAQCDIWVNVHHLAATNTTYQDAMANALKTCYGTCFIELSNETWNSAFDQYAWFLANAGVQDQFGYYADLADTMFERFAGISSKFKGILASQAVQSSLYTRLKEAVRPLNYVYGLAIGPYWGGTWCREQSLIDPDIVTNTSFADMSTIAQADFDTNWKPEIELWKSYCDIEGWELMAYEFGPHFSPHPGVSKVTYADCWQHCYDYVKSDEAVTVYTDFLAWWESIGGSIACKFVDTNYNEWGSNRTETEISPVWTELLTRMKSE